MSENNKPELSKQSISEQNLNSEKAIESNENTGDFTDVIVGSGIAIILYAGLIWFSITYQGGQSLPIFLLTGITAAALGWIVGILASPYSTKEKSTFSEHGRLVYGFVSGYILSKLDPLIRHLVEPTSSQGMNEMFVAIALVSIASFSIAVSVTYINRTYWHAR